MFRRSWTVFLLLAALHQARAVENDYRDLFNGKDLDGWVVEGDKEYKDGDATKPVWVAHDGMVSCMVNNRTTYGWLRYDGRQFGDFALHVEYRMTPRDNEKQARCNSGVAIRTIPFDPKHMETRASVSAYEVQLLDDADLPPDKHSNASLYNYVAPKESAARPSPEWNTMDIDCVGPHIKIALNDKVVIDVDQSTIAEIKDKPLKGYIGLQDHGGRIDFRNVRIREIAPK
jgi:hypothetical protein